jgi:hypothetical protein
MPSRAVFFLRQEEDSRLIGNESALNEEPRGEGD